MINRVKAGYGYNAKYNSILSKKFKNTKIMRVWEWLAGNLDINNNKIRGIYHYIQNQQDEEEKSNQELGKSVYQIKGWRESIHQLCGWKRIIGKQKMEQVETSEESMRIGAILGFMGKYEMMKFYFSSLVNRENAEVMELLLKFSELLEKQDQDGGKLKEI